MQPVGNGCGLVPDETAWKLLVASFKGGDGATLQVRATDAGSFSRVGIVAPRTLRIAEEDIQGGLYYWNATPGTIVRYDFGKAGQKANVFYTAADAKALDLRRLSRDVARRHAHGGGARHARAGAAQGDRRGHPQPHLQRRPPTS